MKTKKIPFISYVFMSKKRKEQLLERSASLPIEEIFTSRAKSEKQSIIKNQKQIQELDILLNNIFLFFRKYYDHIPKTQQIVVYHFFTDTYSTLINSYNLAKGGYILDALALNRLVIENLCYLQGVDDLNQYIQILDRIIKNKSLKNFEPLASHVKDMVIHQDIAMKSYFAHANHPSVMRLLLNDGKTLFNGDQANIRVGFFSIKFSCDYFLLVLFKIYIHNKIDIDESEIKKTIKEMRITYQQ